MEQNYPKFRELLRKAICTKTQAQFANESHISAEHLNRMLNTETINRPTRTTLLKIAAVAKNGVTFQDMMDALDADTEPKNGNGASESRLLEAKKDFEPSFEEKAHATMQCLCAILESKSYPISYPVKSTGCISAYINDIMHTLRRNNTLPITYEMGTERKNFGHYHKNIEYYVPVYLSMADRTKTATSQMIVYYDINAADGDAKKDACIIQDVTCKMEDIFDQYGYPVEALDMANQMLNGELPYPKGLEKPEPEDDSKEHNEELDKELMSMALCHDLPYYLGFYPTERFTEKYVGTGKTPEERLLNCLFGDKTLWSETIPGFGFWIDDVPDKLARMLDDHSRTISDYYDNKSERDDDEKQTLIEAIRKTAEGNDPAGIANILDDMDFMDEDVLGDIGWPAAVSLIMHRETGFPFTYHAPGEPDERFPGLSEHGCIIVGNSDIEEMGILRETLLLTVCRYAKELGIRKFGDILFTGVHDELLYKPMTYVVKDTEETDIAIDPGIDGNDFIPFDRNDESTFPRETGPYVAELKDGRYVKLIYIASHKAWIRAHKEWSNMILGYHPEIIKDLDKMEPADLDKKKGPVE